MKTYEFLVSLCGGWCNGSIFIDANDENEAYNKAMDHVANKLVKAFPTLDIEYSVECENPDDEEHYTAYKHDCDGAIIDSASFYSKEAAIKHAQRHVWHEVVNDDTDEVVWRTRR